MGPTVTLPLWVFLFLAVLSAWAVLSRFLVPSVRWVLRRRVNRAIEELNDRLHIRLQPFKLTKRAVLLDRLIHDPRVLEAVEEHAEAEGAPREVVQARVRRYADEIVPAFNAYLYFRFGYWLARKVGRFLYRVRLGSEDQAALRAVPPDATVVFVMNHRSNMDYVLVSYLVAERAALSYAVGEWARIWPLQSLIRSMGAYFVRRGSGNPLYRRVLERYVHMATEAGVTQAIFPEGGLSRDGRLRPPKLGLLDYMIRGHRPGRSPEIVFVPVGLNYDRVLEDRTLLLDLLPDGERRRAPALRTTLAFVGRNLRLLLFNRWHRFGYACVSFGRPVALGDFLTERRADPRSLEPADRFELVGELAEVLLEAVEEAVPALPVPLVAEAVLEAAGEGRSELEIKAVVASRMKALEAAGRPVYIPRQDREYAVEVGLRMLRLRRLLVENDGLLEPAPEELDLLRYYAGSLPRDPADPATAPMARNSG